MRSIRPFHLALCALAAGCDDRSLADRPVHTPQVPAEIVRTIDLDAVMPSDAWLGEDGSILVLDGYGGRVLRVDPGSSEVKPFSREPLGRASRLSPAADGGFWIARPGDETEAGTLLRLDASGATVGVRVPRDAEGGALHPVDVLDRGGELWLADRTDGLVLLGADDVAVRGVTTGVDGASLRRPVDLAELPSGFVTADLLAPRIRTFTLTGSPTSEFGRPGLAVGTLARPTSVAATAGGLLVADSVLGVIQAFESDGDPIGALAVGGAPARFGHPVAVRTQAALAGQVVVLEADPARITVLRIGPLPAAGPPPLLRTTLVAADADPAGETGASCSQCHDGLLLDSRELWDEARSHHPVGVVPEKEIPAFFPLDDEGRLTCRTCHSPHGVVEGVADDASPLVRHAAAGSPFTRLDRASDTLCTACHGEAVHDEGATTDRATTGGGHLAGQALVDALEERGTSQPELGQGRCLSCHAVHGAASDPLMRSPDEASVCVGCHDTQQAATTNHPLGRVPGRDLLKVTAGSAVRLSGDGGVGCLTCHDLTTAAPALLRRLDTRGPVCLECHTARGDLSEGPHHSLGRGGLPACLSCHDLHGGAHERHFVATGPTTEADPRGCLQCHEKDRSGAAPGELGHPVDGRALTQTTAGSERLDCLACHDPHLADRPDAGACADCHADQGAARDAGGHGAADCLDCHPAHGAEPAWGGPENPASARCLACHAESRAPAGTPSIASYEHPAPSFLPDGSRWTPLGGLLLFGPDGEALPAGKNGELGCPSCHVVHGPDGGTDHLRRAGGWQEACSACHGQDALIFYRDFHSPERRASLLEPGR